MPAERILVPRSLEIAGMLRRRTVSVRPRWRVDFVRDGRRMAPPNLTDPPANSSGHVRPGRWMAVQS